MSEKLNLLIVSLVIPYPLNAGGNISQFAILDYLQHHINISMCLTVYNDDQMFNVEQLKQKLFKVSFEIIDERPLQIEPIIRRTRTPFVLKLAKKITQKLENTLSPKIQLQPLLEKAKDELDDTYRISPIYVKTPSFCAKLEKIVASKKYNAIQVEFYEYVDLVEMLPKEIPSIFVHHEIKFERIKNSSDKSDKSTYFKNYINSITKTFEIGCLNKYNHVITFSNVDRKMLENELSTDVSTIPFPVLSNEFYKDREVEKIDKLIFVGAENHYPNAEGVIWFLENCFETVWSKFKIPLYIIGNWSGDTIAKYGSGNKIVFTGFVENLKEITQNSINISPIRIGSGIRTKILYAMANKMVVVTTSKGVEGIEVNHLQEVLVADSESDFVSSIESLINDTKLIKNLTEAAFQYVQNNYSQRTVVFERMLLYSKLAEVEKSKTAIA